MPAGVAASTGSVDTLRYQTPRETAAAHPGELLTLKLRYKEPQGDESRLLVEHAPHEVVPFDEASDDLRFAASVAAFGMLLRGSEHAGNASFAQIDSIVRTTLADDPGGWRAEFVRLVARARELTTDAALPEIAHR